jgi:hypothetical protein
VDDFGPGVERSVKGALHFHPSSTKSITIGEWEHLKAKHRKIAALLQVVPEGDGAKASESVAEAVEKAVEAATEATAEEAAPAPKHKKQKW